MMDYDNQETIYWELEAVNEILDEYFTENLPNICISRKVFLGRGITRFFITNYNGYPQDCLASYPTVEFGENKFIISITTSSERIAWELDLGDPKTPEKIQEFLEKYAFTYR